VPVEITGLVRLGWTVHPVPAVRIPSSSADLEEEDTQNPGCAGARDLGWQSFIPSSDSETLP